MKPYGWLIGMGCLWASGILAQPMAAHGTMLVDVSGKLTFQRSPDPLTAGLGGPAWIDFDGDGDLDLFLTSSTDQPNALFRNEGGMFTEVAAEAGVAGGAPEVGFSASAGAAAADIDNDGCVDLFVIGGGGVGGPASFGQPHKLYVNNCDGTFTDASATAGIEAPHPAMMAAFGDIDNDGDVDLFITSPGSFVSGMGPQALYLNNGDRTFTDISALAGIDTANGGCVAAFTDYNSDGRQDIIVGNCNLLEFPEGEAPVVVPGPWELWKNNGDLTFTDMADAAGLNVRPGFPMALTLADYNGDGHLDLFATGLGAAFTPRYGVLAEQVLFRNNGDGTYSDTTAEAGLLGFEWGWGASFADFDNDGDEDLLTVGSMPPAFGVIGPSLANPGRLFENQGTGTFSPVQRFNLEGRYTSGLAVGDYTGDGFIDAVVSTAPFEATSLLGGTFRGDGAPVLLENTGNGNHWIRVRLEGTVSNTSGVGAVVRTREGATQQTKQVQAGTGFASSNSLWLIFGLGSRDKVDLQVTWPSGLVETFNGLRASQTVTLIEGTGKTNLDIDSPLADVLLHSLLRYQASLKQGAPPFPALDALLPLLWPLHRQ